MAEPLTHQQGLNAAAAIAGAGLEVALYLYPRDGTTSAHATVTVNTYGKTVDELVAMRERIRQAGWVAELDGSDFAVKAKAKAKP